MTKTHKGAPRRYFCPRFFDANGKLDLSLSGCCHKVISERDTGDDADTTCLVHGEQMRTTRFKRVEERQWERSGKARMIVGGMAVWTDVARRKAKCHLCMQTIMPGEARIAFDANNPHRTTVTMAGGVIKSIRHYVHQTCFIDMIMDGTPGKGCPGCSAKMVNDEFQAVRKQLVKRHG